MSAARIERQLGWHRPPRSLQPDGAGENPRDILDLDEALQRIPGGKAAVWELGRIMLEECPRLLDEIRTGLKSGDAERLRRGAHTLRGSADVFAARRVVEAARRVEELGRDGKLDGASVAIADLEREVDLFSATLRSAIDSGLDGP